MSTRVPVFTGDAALEEVVGFVQDTPPETLLVCAKSAETLSRVTVHLVRRLRGSQGRIEFHQPSSPEAMLQAVNRLMQDIPIDQLTATQPGDGCRMLIVERGEEAREDEVLALRRLAAALRGSAFQLVVLAKTTVAPVDHPTLWHLAPQAGVWLVDFTVGFGRFESASSVVSRREAMQAGITDALPVVTAPAPEPSPKPQPKPEPKPEPEPKLQPAARASDPPRRVAANKKELADILMQLAQERDKSSKK